MPTEQWMKERQLVTFWLLKAEYAEFVRACKKAGKGQAQALRETVRVVLSAKDGQDA